MKVFILLSILTISFTANAWSLFGSYDDCILDKIDSGMSNSGVSAVKRACRNKFPIKKTKIKSMNLPSSVINKIEGKISFHQKPYSSDKEVLGSFYNGSDWFISSLIIRIHNKNTKKYRDYESPISIGSYITVTPPLQKGEFSFDVYEKPSSWTWSLVGGTGYKK